MPPAYAPRAGDIIYLTFDPQAGHEQAGRRPALVVSPASFNRTTALAWVCPITSTITDNPFEVYIPPGRKVGGGILVDQLKSLDWQVRRAEFVEEASAEVLQHVRNLIARILKFSLDA
jgi:mRNA interferase MazF